MVQLRVVASRNGFGIGFTPNASSSFCEVADASRFEVAQMLIEIRISPLTIASVNGFRRGKEWLRLRKSKVARRRSGRGRASAAAIVTRIQSAIPRVGPAVNAGAAAFLAIAGIHEIRADVLTYPPRQRQDDRRGRVGGLLRQLSCSEYVAVGAIRDQCFIKCSWCRKSIERFDGFSSPHLSAASLIMPGLVGLLIFRHHKQSVFICSAMSSRA